MPLNPTSSKANSSFEYRFNIFFYLAAAAAICLAAFIPLKNYGVFDDAYMFIRYADNLAHGGTYGWNLHEKTYGCTSIPYTFFVLVLMKLGLGRVTTPSHLIALSSLCWGIASLVLFYRMLKLLTKGNTWFAPSILKCIVLLVSLMPIFLPHFFSGMDTTMSIFANTLMIFAFLCWQQSPSTPKLILAAIAAYFTFLVRPDNLIYAALFPFLFLLGHKRPLREIVLTCAVIGGLLVLDTLGKWAYFGNPLPLPFYAKSSGFYTGYIGIARWNSMEYAAIFALSYGAPLLVFYLISFSRTSLRQAAIYLLPFLLTLAYLSTVVQIMGSQSRYYIPSIPFLTAGLIRGTAISLPAQPTFPLRKLVFALTAVIALLFCNNYLPSFYMTAKLRKASAQVSAIPNDYPLPPPAPASMDDLLLKARNDLNDFLQRNHPDKITIAASEHGYIGACNPEVPIMDLCGLHNRKIATAGYTDSDLASFAPDLIWMVHSDYRVLYRQIVKGPYFQQAYEFYPDLLAFGLAIKKNSPYYALIKDQLAKNATPVSAAPVTTSFSK